jgi:hypothetical protein
MYVSLKIVKAMPFKSLELRLTVLLFLVSQDRNSFALMQTHCPGMEENGCHRTTLPSPPPATSVHFVEHNHI